MSEKVLTQNNNKCYKSQDSGVINERQNWMTYGKHLKIIEKLLVSFIAGAVFFSLLLIGLFNHDWVLFNSYSDVICSTRNSSVGKPSKIPSIVWYTPNIWWIHLTKRIKCLNRSQSFECDVFRKQSQPEDPDAYLFYAADIDKFPLPRNPKKIWGLIHDESPINRLMFLHEKSLNLFNFSATYSRYSNIPMPLMSMRGLEFVTSPEYFVNTSMKNLYLKEIAPVMYMQSNCFTTTERDSFVRKLMEYINVDSYGYCMNNNELPLHRRYISLKTYRYHQYGEELLRFMGRYKFIVAIENAVCNDYVSEKIWRAIEIGTVPIYFGSPLIRDWLPNHKSAILVEDFPTPELLSKHLHHLLMDDIAYEEYLEHKTLGLIRNQKLIDEIDTRPFQINMGQVAKKLECLVCEEVQRKNSDSINIVTKMHYDCPLPTDPGLILPVNPDNKVWRRFNEDGIRRLDRIYEEIQDLDQTPRSSNTSWWLIYA